MLNFYLSKLLHKDKLFSIIHLSWYFAMMGCEDPALASEYEPVAQNAPIFYSDGK